MHSLVKEYQTVLKKANLYNGAIDGKVGPLTATAAFSYHCPNGSYSPKWMKFAIGELGVSELYGSKRNNPRIAYYHSFTTLAAKEDEVPWCASFVNCCLIEGAEIAGTKSASAKSFESWGRSCNVNTYGAVHTVKTKTGSMRHVFFNAGFYKDLILGLGGNQSNSVTIMNRSKGEIVASRYKL
jgi:uncharacterized protein (TIGR02594 family)